MNFLSKLLTGLLLLLCISGCASKENNNAEKENAPAAVKLNNFERPTPPALLTNTQDIASYLISHFWDKFDFSDTLYCHAPEITEQGFVDFINLFTFTSPDKVSQGVKKLLDSAEESIVMYNYFLNLAEQYFYNPNSPFRNDEFFIYFLEHVVYSTKVVEDNKARHKYILDLANKNRIGTKALDFVYTLNSGRTGNLYSINSDYVLLMFFNPDCLECRNALSELKNAPEVTAAISSGRLKALTVYVDEDIEIWKNHLDEVPSSWINGYDKSLSIKSNEIYDTKAIPTLYLFDKNKIVLLKDTSVGAINAYLGSI